MCAQFYVDEETEKELRALADSFRGLRRGTVRPSDSAAVLTGGKERYAVKQMTWGIPRPAGKGLVINARSETMAEKPMFRESSLYRRCAVPAGGFMEWDEQKVKVTFCDPQQPVLFLAGVFELTAREPRFVVLTRAANESVVRYHDRMPLLLSPEGLHCWLAQGGDYTRCLQAEMPVLRAWQEVEQLRMF